MIKGVFDIRKRLGNCSESTVMGLIFREGLPAKRDKNGEWCVSEKDFESWQVGRKKAVEPEDADKSPEDTSKKKAKEEKAKEESRKG